MRAHTKKRLENLGGAADRRRNASIRVFLVDLATGTVTHDGQDMTIEEYKRLYHDDGDLTITITDDPGAFEAALGMGEHR